MKTIKINRTDLPKNSKTPILTYCRQLIKDGEDPTSRLEIYGSFPEFDIAVSSLEEGAKLGVSEEPYIRFVKYADVRFKT